jgi:hypothetical protein
MPSVPIITVFYIRSIKLSDMKKLTVFMLAISCIAAVSCEKDSKVQTNNNGGNTELNTFRLTVDGMQYQPASVLTQHNSEMITIQGAEGLGASFSLAIRDSLMPGNHAMSPFGPTRLTMSFNAFADSYTSSQGTLTIVTHDTVNNAISGTYHCYAIKDDASDTVNVTGGEFNVNY